MRTYTFHDVLVNYPLVHEDAPEWKKICPFCGEFDCVHEVGNTYACHWCHANWLENDTENERQIQVLHLNNGKMPRFGEGDMPLVERTLYKEFEYSAEINLADNTVTLFDGKNNRIAERQLDEESSAVFFQEGEVHDDERAAGF